MRDQRSQRNCAWFVLNKCVINVCYHYGVCLSSAYIASGQDGNSWIQNEKKDSKQSWRLSSKKANNLNKNLNQYLWKECIISHACAVVISEPEWWNKWRHNFLIYHMSCIIINKSFRGRLFAYQKRNLSVGHTSIHSRVSQSVIWAELRLSLELYSDYTYNHSRCFKILKISEF